MRSRNWSLAYAIGALVLALAMVPGALAQCSFSTKLVKPSSWHPQMGGVHLLTAALAGKDDDDDDSPSIVGMWHAVFVAHTINGNPIPSDSYPVIDNAVVVWHSDKTEIMNSGRPAQDGNFCLGVWTKTGRMSYYLNHIPWLGNDPSNAPGGIGNPQDGAQILEKVTLSSDGNSYSGTFKLDAYDATGHIAVSFTGVIRATRITTSTPFTSLL